MLGWVVAGTGVALSPRSVLSTFPDKKATVVRALPPGENRAEGVRRNPSQICDPAGFVVQIDAEMARSERFELPALGIEIRCSIQLSYERPGPGIGPQPKCPRPLLASQQAGRRSDGFELAERRANKKPFPPRFEAGQTRSYQVLLKKPKCGCCAITIIGRPCCGAGCVLATLRLGCCAGV